MRTLLKCSLAVGALALLAGCNSGVSSQKEFSRIMYQENLFPEYPRAGRTYLSFNRLHGFQVEYFGANKTNFLWYPGNKVVLPGRWKVDGQFVCYQYGSNTYNPVTNKRGGKWSCSPREFSAKGVVASLKGDPYGLSRSKKAPYVLQKCKAPEKFKLRRAATC
ncbi:hypothetical protein [Pseudovibrio sp. JE062]|uniref:hypothetical protein n=1 Tax=Pseudovibrio sp. JE062 TaxID=439495 RepID=UPI000186B688|nr:hypothetical protein [Pseudovibrio sp. JE062]EEA96486.1 hypothetical protein PJE062_1323 [Pseudovibrio sp. JE062]